MDLWVYDRIFQDEMDIVRLDTLMRDNLAYLAIFFISIFFLYVYADVIVDITPQLITLNQRSKSDIVSQEQTIKHIDTYKNSFLFLRIDLLLLKVTLGTGFQSVKSTFVFRSEYVRIIRVKRK
jgi:hypothetical protein